MRLTCYAVAVAREHAFCAGESLFEFVDALPDFLEAFVRFAYFGESVKKVVAQAIQQAWWACVLDLRARDDSRGARGSGGRVGRVVCVHVDLPLCALQEAPEQLAALKRGMAADAFEEELQVLCAFFDEFVAKSIAGEVFQTVLVGQRGYDAGGEVAFEAFAEEGKVVEAATSGHVGAREVGEVGLGTDAVADESILLPLELLARLEDLDHQVARP